MLTQEKPPGLREHIVFPAACVRAESALGAAAGKIRAHKAAAGIGYAHRAMAERLKLHLRHGILYPADLVQRYFAAQHNTAESELTVHFYGGTVDAACLGTQMKRRIRKMLSDQRNDSQVLNDERVYRILTEIIQIRGEGVYVPVMKRNIERAVKFPARIALFQRADILVFVIVEIVRLDAEREFL